MTRKKQAIIIGGGFTGLAAATALLQSGWKVTLIESKGSLGGLAAGFGRPRWESTLEETYHHWFTSDQLVQKYAKIWKAEKGLVQKRVQSVMETSKGGFAPLDSLLALLRYPDLMLHNRVRMGVALAYLKLTRNWRRLENVTAESWCRLNMGNEGFEKIWQPLLKGKFGSEASLVNMAWLWARLHCRTRSLVTYEGGFARLLEKARRWLEEHDDFALYLGTKVENIHHDTLWQISCSQSTLKADALIFATPPSALSHFFPDVLLPSSQVLGVHVILMLLDRPLSSSKTYWYSLRKSDSTPFLAVIDHSKLVPASEFDGKHPVYIANYLPSDSSEFSQSDESLITQAIALLSRINPRFSRDQVSETIISRIPYAQPVATIRASQMLPPRRIKEYPALYWGSIAHVYPWDRGTNFALDLGEDLARLVIADFSDIH